MQRFIRPNIGLRFFLCDLLVGLSCLCAFFKAALFSPDIIGSYPDVWVTLWSIDHVSHFPEKSLYTTSELFAPEGSLLVLHNLTESVGLLGSLLGLSSPEYYNALCSLIFGINFLCAMRLFSEYSSSRLLCYTCSLLFTFHPYNLAHLDAGHLNLISSFPLLLVWLGITRILRAKPLGTAILSLGTTLAVFTDWYLLYFCITSAALMGCNMAWRRISPQRSCDGAGLEKLIAGTLIGLLLGSYKIYLALACSENYTGHHAPIQHSLNLVHFFYPTKYQLVGEVGHGFIPTLPTTWNLVNGAESAAYSGAVLLIAFTFLTIRSWKSCDHLLWFALLTAGISCGPEIKLAHISLFPNPVFLLTYCLPIPLPVPARAYILTLLFGLLHIINQTQQLGGATTNTTVRHRVLPFLCLLTLIEFLPSNPRLSKLPKDPLLYQLRDMDIDIIVDAGQPELATFRSMLHNKPISGGFLARRPKTGLRFHRALMRKLRDCAPSEAQAIIVEKHQVELREHFEKCTLLKRIGSSEGLSIWTKTDLATSTD